MREAVVSLNESVSFTVPVTKNEAVFKFSVPPGVYVLKVLILYYSSNGLEFFYFNNVLMIKLPLRSSVPITNPKIL